MNIGGEYHVPVDYGDNLDLLLAKYHGKAYQVMNVRSVATREEW
ncbi:hypothetical protein [Weissella confusa]|nr:hypothetical protein [Weissella confusa]